jgi:hypothetical protein
MKKRKTNSYTLKSIEVTRITRTVYFFVVLFCASIIIFDAGNLLTRDVIIQRWSLATIVLVINTLVWLFASQSAVMRRRQAYLAWFLALSLLLLAGYMTYLERGMASTSTILYAIPLLVIGTLKNRHALQAFTVLAAGTYAYAAVRYFNEFFNEGLRIQLWGTVVLTTAALFTVSWLIMTIAGLRHDSK